MTLIRIRAVRGSSVPWITIRRRTLQLSLKMTNSMSGELGGRSIRVDFLYWEDCPSHERALQILQDAMQEQRIESPITIKRVDTEEEARRLNFPGSPTIRVNGTDIEGEQTPPPGLTCRTYVTDDGRISPLPPRTRIVAALQAAARTKETA